MDKKLRTTLFAVLITGVLCAGTVSARQLQQTSTVNVCNSTCSKKVPCSNSDCSCFIQPGDRLGTCLLVK